MARNPAAALGLVLMCAQAACTTTPGPQQEAQQPESPKLDAPKLELVEVAVVPPPMQKGGNVDRSGRPQKGRASYYAHHFTNRTMANGQRFNPDSNVAASKTLPLGTTAKVTNVQNGKSATVTINDRGPYVGGRVVDVTPKVADELDIRKQGVAPVIVAPIAVPQPDGAVKLGAGAAEASPQEIEEAKRQATTR